MRRSALDVIVGFFYNVDVGSNAGNELKEIKIMHSEKGKEKNEKKKKKPIFQVLV